MGKDSHPRCYFEISINGVPQGRIVFQLFDDVAPQTCANFLQLCEGSERLGRETGKPLSYRGCLFHRVIKDFMIQGGDFSNNNGTGGESVFGGVFDDESFDIKHDKPYILSMANRGPDTNGSQFFIITQPAPELDGKHVAFGSVLYGKSVVRAIEKVKVNSNNRPEADAVITDCGRLIPKGHKEKSEKERDSPEESEKEKPTESKKEEKNVSSIRPEDLPEVPQTGNFLLRRIPETDKTKDESRYSRSSNRNRYSYDGIKVKGRGTVRYRPRSKSPPPHWKYEERRLIPMKEAQELIARKRKEAEKSSDEKADKIEKDKSPSLPASDDEESDDGLPSVRKPRENTPEVESDKEPTIKKSPAYENPVADFVKISVRETSPRIFDNESKENVTKKLEKRRASKPSEAAPSKRRKERSPSSSSSTSSAKSSPAERRRRSPDRQRENSPERRRGRSPIRRRERRSPDRRRERSPERRRRAHSPDRRRDRSPARRHERHRSSSREKSPVIRRRNADRSPPPESSPPRRRRRESSGSPPRRRRQSSSSS